MNTNIIFIIILLAITFISFAYNVGIKCTPISCLLLIFVSILLGEITILTNSINPIEVYRGNTTLEITYKDNVPIDSIVVLKNR